SLLSSSQQNDALLTQYKNELALYESRLSEAQAQLEQMLGVKTQIIRSLSDAFKRNNIQVDVDEETGAIVLPGAALFDSGKTELKPEGMRYLDRFLPVYLSVLLSNEFRPYVAEIIIEGHTDSTAKQGYDAFLYNLELSQERALAVASYVLDDTYMRNTLRLSNSGIAAFKKVISAAGRSFSSLKYNADGSENKEASRRVEIKFSLIDEESVYATRQIMGS
ncbi:MAG: OmpA family protein, partial [Clostridia bacterium]|nr:OmpA family protein [Clostridia bacterium]